MKMPQRPPFTRNLVSASIKAFLSPCQARDGQTGQLRPPIDVLIGNVWRCLHPLFLLLQIFTLLIIKILLSFRDDILYFHCLREYVGSLQFETYLFSIIIIIIITALFSLQVSVLCSKFITTRLSGFLLTGEWRHVVYGLIMGFGFRSIWDWFEWKQSLE